LVVAALAGASGCGSETAGQQPPDATASSARPAPPPTAAAPPSGPPSTPTDQAESVTVAGTISRGADARGCLDLTDEVTGVTWTLVGSLVEGAVGAGGELADGDRVRVTGRVRPEVEGGAASYACQVPLTVERISRL
jgi:hypothetical protein